jgi:hypothetical protein
MPERSWSYSLIILPAVPAGQSDRATVSEHFFSKSLEAHPLSNGTAQIAKRIVFRIARPDRWSNANRFIEISRLARHARGRERPVRRLKKAVTR